MRLKLFIYGFCTFLAFWAAGCETIPVSPGGPRDLKTICDQNNVQWYADNVSHVISLRASGREAKAMVGSSVVLLDGQKVFLSDTIRQERGSVLVPADFYEKVIVRLIAGGRIPRAGYHIVVDPGHGGKDPGTRGRVSGLEEKVVNLDIARRLKVVLEGRGFRVTMTRVRDEFISLEQRSEIATRAKADLFVSIHANSSPSRSIDGIEVYALRDLEGAERHEAQRLKNQRILFRSLAMQSNDANVETILADMLYNYKLSESQLLATYINKGVSLTAGVNNRGVKRAGFNVLRNTLVPAVLVEVGFLTNAREESLLRQGDYRQKIAEGIAASLTSFATR